MRKVIGIGETVLDIIFRGNQPVSAVPGGSTFNSLISLGRTGVACCFISETGADRVGQQIVDFLDENGVDSGQVMRCEGVKSPLSLAFLDAQNNADYVFYKDHEHDRLQFSLPPIEPDDVVLFGSFYALNPVIRQQVGRFLHEARQSGAILYYDVNFRASHRHERRQIDEALRENLNLAHIVRGSDEDFNILYGLSAAEDVFREHISPFCSNLIYTRGDCPVQVFGRGNVRLEHAFEPIQAVSTIGAGDNFNAGFIFQLLRSGITRSQIEQGLNAGQWAECLQTAAAFSRECCLSMGNYVSVDFGKRIAGKASE